MSEEIKLDLVKSLPRLFFEQAARFGEDPFLSAKYDGHWKGQSWSMVAEQVSMLAYGLQKLGVGNGDRVVIVAENRPEWLIADLAIMSIGAITVPAYTTNTAADHLHILTDSGAKLAIVSTKRFAGKLVPAADKAPSLTTIVFMERMAMNVESEVELVHWDAVMETGLHPNIESQVDMVDRIAPACIIYTSGTSGDPKGVVLSHGAVLCNCAGAYNFLKDLPGFVFGGESFLSFLPLSHSYEHTCGQFLPIAIGAKIYYAEGPDKLVANMNEVSPTIMAAVPRLYEAIRGRIYRSVEQAGGIKEKLFLKTVALGRKAYEYPGSLSFLEKLQNGILEKLIREKIRQNFGGELKAFVSGGAALNYEVGVDFLALGLRILQGYGQTESAPVVSCNMPHRNKIHTVGPALQGVEVKIAADGEILVRGELIMEGYWKLPNETAETIRDGWLHTGDIGILDEDGFIQITDRKKDIIVNSGGDNISPARVEGMLTAEPEIEQAMVQGDRRPHLVGLIVPSQDFADRWAKENDTSADLETLVDNAEFSAEMNRVVDRVNESLSVIERVRRAILVAESFSIENKMMTPTLKLRRHIIGARYGEALEALYGK